MDSAVLWTITTCRWSVRSFRTRRRKIIGFRLSSLASLKALHSRCREITKRSDRCSSRKSIFHGELFYRVWERRFLSHSLRPWFPQPQPWRRPPPRRRCAGFFYIPRGAIQGDTLHGAAMDRWTPSGSGASLKLNVITSRWSFSKSAFRRWGIWTTHACSGARDILEEVSTIRHVALRT